MIEWCAGVTVWRIFRYAEGIVASLIKLISKTPLTENHFNYAFGRTASAHAHSSRPKINRLIKSNGTVEYEFHQTNAPEATSPHCIIDSLLSRLALSLSPFCVVDFASRSPN